MTLRVLLGCYCNLLHRKNRLENQSSPLPSVPSVLEPSKTLRESNVAMERTHLKRSSVRCELSITEFVRIFWAQNDLTLGLSHLTMSNNSMLNGLRTTWLSVARFRNYTVFILSIPNMSEHIPTVGHEGSSCPWENLTISVMVWYCIYIYIYGLWSSWESKHGYMNHYKSNSSVDGGWHIHWTLRRICAIPLF